MVRILHVITDWLNTLFLAAVHPDFTTGILSIDYLDEMALNKAIKWLEIQVAPQSPEEALALSPSEHNHWVITNVTGDLGYYSLLRTLQ